MKRALIALLILVSASARAKDLECNTNDHDIDPGFRYDDLSNMCRAVGPGQCQDPLQQVVQSSANLHRQLASTCDTAKNINSQLSGLATQAESQKQAIQVLGQGIDSYTAYLNALDREFQLIHGKLKVPSGPLAPVPTTASTAPIPDSQPIKQKIIAALSRNEPQKNDLLSINHRASTPSDVTFNGQTDPTLLASINGATYLGKILVEKEKTKAMIDSLTSDKNQAVANLNNQKPPGEKTPPKSSPSTVSESGFDMKSLMGLATAGAGLAGLMQQKKEAAASTDTAGATSPTPDSSGIAGGPQGPANSKFGDDKSASQAPLVGQATPKKEPGATGARTPSGYGYRDSSDISKSAASAFPASGSSSPMSTKPGGGSMMAGSLGANPPGGDPENPAGKGAGNPPGSDETQGIGSGGLGGGGPPSLGGAMSPLPADAAAAPPAGLTPEDSMKDLLHEMKETAEGANSPSLQASAADIAMTEEDLFPRVRAAYVRLQKQGRVLDGLGEKVTE